MNVKTKFVYAALFLLITPLAYGQTVEPSALEYLLEHFNLGKERHSSLEPTPAELDEFTEEIRLLQKLKPDKCAVGFWITEKEMIPVASGEKCKAELMQLLAQNYERYKGADIKIRGLGRYEEETLSAEPVKEALLTHRLILQIVEKEPPPAALEALQEEVNRYIAPQVTGSNTCTFGILYAIETGIYLRANSVKCFQRLNDYFVNNYGSISATVINLQTTKEYQKVIDYMKQQIAAMMEGKKSVKGGGGEPFRIEVEKNKNEEEYVGLVGDGENTLTFSVYFPPDKKNFLKIRPPSAAALSAGNIALDKSLLEEGILKVTYRPSKLCSAGNSDQVFRVELWEDPMIGKEKLLDTEFVRFKVFRMPIFILHGLWGPAESMAQMEQYLEGKYQGKNNENDLIFNFDYFAYNLEDIGSNGERLKKYVDDISDRYVSDYLKIKPGKVELVAFSVGGMASRSYIQNLGGYEKVNKLVTLGTPHLGAPAMQIIYDGCPSLNPDADLVACGGLLTFAQKARKIPGLSEDVFQTGPVIIQLLPSSSFLEQLNRKSDLHEDEVEYVLIAGTKQMIPRFEGEAEALNWLASKAGLFDDKFKPYFYRYLIALSDPEGDGLVPIESARGEGLFETAKRLETPASHADIFVKPEVFDLVHGQLNTCEIDISHSPLLLEEDGTLVIKT